MILILFLTHVDLFSSYSSLTVLECKWRIAFLKRETNRYQSEGYHCNVALDHLTVLFAMLVCLLYSILIGHAR